jgi:D-alanine-D-alanine ligase-like ATP-grasp enzyme
MSYFDEVYLKRLNRYGNDYKTRVQGQREKVFEDLLLKSIYRVDFFYKEESQPGLLERYK